MAWFKEKAAPGFEKFGALKHELYKEEKRDVFVERLFFIDCYEVKDFFAEVKADPKAWKLSRMYEKDFGAKDVRLKVLDKVC